MAQAALTESILLIGRVRGQNYTPARLKRWTMEIWGHSMDQMLVVITMTRGCFSLTFLQPDQANWVL